MGTGIQTSSNNGITTDIHSQRRKRKTRHWWAGDVDEDDDLQGWARTNDLLGHRSQSPDASASIATCNTAYGYRSRLSGVKNQSPHLKRNAAYYQAPSWNRTCDILLTRQVLCQLSYRGKLEALLRTRAGLP